MSLSLTRAASCLAATLFSVSAIAQQAEPQPTPMPAPIEAPADSAYPGTIRLDVNATDLVHRVLHVHEAIPVAAGELTLLYPQWIPGNHSPTGPISKLSGLFVKADGKPISWVRDRVDVYAFHVQVPAGVKTLSVDFDYLSPLRKGEGRISMSNEMIDLQWNTVVLYPAGHFARQITLEPTLKLPEGWKYATALNTASQKSGEVHFVPTTLNTLVDSPLYAGLYYNRVDLSTSAENKVYLNVFGDKEADVVMTPEQIQLHKELAQQAQKLYASHHYDRYEFLFLLSDKVGGIGLEHHQSSEDGSGASYFTKWKEGISGRDLLAHEYTHSWNGKFRRPADLWTANFNVPMRDDLLWVYEGMTQYWGNILTARAGMRTPSEAHDLLARVAANFDISPGRTWRPLVDTTNQPTISQRSPVSWVTWQRPEDYYTEGMLIWLDADTLIRQLSNNTKSLDDFCKLFFGIDNGSYITATYTLDDVVATLNKVQPYDWAGFLKKRVYDLAPQTPEDGFKRGGYKIVYTDKEPEWQKAAEKPTSAASFSTSLGFAAYPDGAIGEIWWDSLAFKAGITADMQIIAVNGKTFSIATLREAIVAAEKSKDPIQLIIKSGSEVKTFSFDYRGGLRFPSLERIPNTPAYLDDILAPVK